MINVYYVSCEIADRIFEEFIFHDLVNGKSFFSSDDISTAFSLASRRIQRTQTR